MIKRFHENLDELIEANKVLVIYGPRRVGKTTLLSSFLKKDKLKYKLDSGDNIKVQQILNSQDFDQILGYVEGHKLIVIDEAQQVPNIGMGLKIIVDQVQGIKVIATGSSSFDLANKIGEPLTGRKNTITLYPISQLELTKVYSKYDLKQKLEEFLVFGSYPEVVSAKTKEEKMKILEELINSYLLRDILSLERVKGSKVIFDLLKLLAFQVGNEVSLNELSLQLRLDIKTVDRYLDLLEKTFVIVRVGALSRNLRKEISSKQKYYFLDNGVMNAVISQFNGLADRNDIGRLWENFIFMERMKKRSYERIYCNVYFWRTYSQKEIDLVEERSGKLFGYEIKWSKDNIKPPKEWSEFYKNSSFEIINQENYLEFIT